MKTELLEDLYKTQILELHDAERQVRRGLNKMARAVGPDLQKIFKGHVKDTRKQIDRLDTILDRLGGAEGGRKSRAMAGLLGESKELLKKPGSDHEVMETAFCLVAQKVEVHEIFTYETLARFARMMNFHQDAELLEQTLGEERRMHERLGGLIENVHVEAAEGEERHAVAG